MSPQLRPVTLDCDSGPCTVAVRQQPYPLDSVEPESWLTTISFGEYPNRIDISLEHPTPEEGIAAAEAIGSELSAAALSLTAEAEAVTQ